MLQFISFGSGSCGNCSFLSNGRDAVLIDAGVGIRQMKRYFREYGVNPQLIRAILITHDHSDHIKAAGYVSAEYRLKVYATTKVHEGMMRNYHTTRKVDAEWRTNLIEDETVQLGSLSITPFVLPHDSAENVGFRIVSDGEVFTLMTDVGNITDVVRQHIADSNYVVLEADYDEEMLVKGSYHVYLQERIRSGLGHLSNAQCAEALAENFHEGLHNVWLCHLSEENNHPELARKTVEYKLRQYGIIAGKDFQLDVLRRGVPTGPWTLGVPETEQLNLFDDEKGI